jgi:hypothetical protein
VNERDLWDRIDALLDERRDPLDDERVQQHFARDRHALDEYVRLSAALAALPRRRSKRRVLAGVMSASALGLAVLLFSTRSKDTPVAPAQSGSGILDFQITVVRRAGSLHSTTTIDGDHRSDEVASVLDPAQPQLVQATLTTAHQRGYSP